MTHGNEITDALKEAAKGPKSASVDGQSATQHSLKELIEADEYLTGKEAAKRRKLPVRITKIRPGGTV